MLLQPATGMRQRGGALTCTPLQGGIIHLLEPGERKTVCHSNRGNAYDVDAMTVEHHARLRMGTLGTSKSFCFCALSHDTTFLILRVSSQSNVSVRPASKDSLVRMTASTRRREFSASSCLDAKYEKAPRAIGPDPDSMRTEKRAANGTAHELATSSGQLNQIKQAKFRVNSRYLLAFLDPIHTPTPRPCLSLQASN